VLFTVAKDEGRGDTLRLMNEHTEVRLSWRGLWLASCNITPAILLGLFTYSHLINFIRYRQVSNLLIVAKEALDGCFFLVRRAPLKTAKSPSDWNVGIGSTLVPHLLRRSKDRTILSSANFFRYSGLPYRSLASSR
jgi:hypothetical protein